jgi:hypothetical protein
MLAPDWKPLEELVGLYDPWRIRDRWLAELRKLTAEILRSPAFLALAKFNLSLLGRRSTPP